MKKPTSLKILSWIVLIPVGIAMIAFSVVNRHAVRLDFWPFDFAPEVRLFAVILGVLAVGIVWGGIAAWLAAGANRRRGREAGRRADSAESENRQLKDRVARLENELREARAEPAASGEPDARPALPPADAA